MTASSPKRAFTLIELLVVIAIITVLMGLLFPVVGSVKDSMRKVQAKNDLMQLVNAVKAYNTEYGRYPIPTATAVDVSYVGTANAPVIDILRYNTAGSNAASVTSMNPRAIVFIEVPSVKDAATHKSGILTTTGVWYDPWGNSYNLAMDGNYDNLLNSSVSPNVALPSFYTDSNFSPISTGVIAWSYGKDGKQGTNGDNKFANGASDDVISWQ